MMNTMKELEKIRLPEWNELPALELYMDQVTFTINSSLAPLFPELPELTRSMVNNYVKNSIVKPPVKKHYKRYHLGFLMVVCLLKPCYALNEIGELITIYMDMGSGTMEQDYNHFIHAYEECLNSLLSSGCVPELSTRARTWQQSLMYSVIETATLHWYSRHLLSEYKKSETD